MRLPQRLCRDLSDRLIALPQFANSVQRMVEVIIQTEARRIKSVQLRPTSTRFDGDGKVDPRDAVEIMAEIVAGSEPKQIGDNVVDIGPAVRTRAREREASWRIPQGVKRLILADVSGGAKLPVVRPPR